MRKRGRDREISEFGLDLYEIMQWYFCSAIKSNLAKSRSVEEGTKREKEKAHNHKYDI